MDSQESSPALQFKSINSSVLSLLCEPTLTFVHDSLLSVNHSVVSESFAAPRIFNPHQKKLDFVPFQEGGCKELALLHGALGTPRVSLGSETHL